MKGRRLVQAGLAGAAALVVAWAAENTRPGSIGLASAGAGLIPVVLAAICRPRLSVMLAIVSGYAGIIAFFQPPPVQPLQAAGLLALACATAGAVWIIRAALFSGTWGCIVETGRVVFAGLALLVLSPLVSLLDAVIGLPDCFPWTVAPAWPAWEGMLVLVLVPLLAGIPSGMAVMRIRHGRTPVLGCLAFLALFPHGELLSLAGRPLVLMMSSFASCMLAGSALANRFPPHVLAAARLSGASRLDLVFRLYLPAAGRAGVWIILMTVWMALDIRERTDPADGLWVAVLRMLPLSVLLVYFLYRVPAHSSGTGHEPDRRAD